MYLVGGEVLFDCFIDEGAGPDQAHIHAVAGGSPFNVARGIARLGGKAAFFGGVSTDPLGRKIRRLLESEGVDAQYVIESEAPTPLSVVGTGPDGSPSYVFYNRGTAECSLTPRSIPAIDERITGFHFGSYTLVAEPIAGALAALASARRDRFISVDPNVRPAIVPEMQVWRRRVEAMVAFANLVKVSREDLDHLYPSEGVEGIAQRWLDTAPDLVIVTDGSAQVCAYRRDGLVEHTPADVAVVDTVGAGDSFQAALLTRIAELGPPADVVSELAGSALRETLEFATAAAAATCRRRGAGLPGREELAP